MQNTPKQTRLLGATVRGLGVIVAVSRWLLNMQVHIEKPPGDHYKRARDAVGTWDEVHSLVPGVVALGVAA